MEYGVLLKELEAMLDTAEMGLYVGSDIMDKEMLWHAEGERYALRDVIELVKRMIKERE